MTVDVTSEGVGLGQGLRDVRSRSASGLRTPDCAHSVQSLPPARQRPPHPHPAAVTPGPGRFHLRAEGTNVHARSDQSWRQAPRQSGLPAAPQSLGKLGPRTHPTDATLLSPSRSGSRKVPHAPSLEGETVGPSSAHTVIYTHPTPSPTPERLTGQGGQLCSGPLPPPFPLHRVSGCSLHGTQPQMSSLASMPPTAWPLIMPGGFWAKDVKTGLSTSWSLPGPATEGMQAHAQRAGLDPSSTVAIVVSQPVGAGADLAPGLSCRLPCKLGHQCPRRWAKNPLGGSFPLPGTSPWVTGPRCHKQWAPRAHSPEKKRPPSHAAAGFLRLSAPRDSQRSRLTVSSRCLFR